MWNKSIKWCLLRKAVQYYKTRTVLKLWPLLYSVTNWQIYFFFFSEHWTKQICNYSTHYSRLSATESSYQTKLLTFDLLSVWYIEVCFVILNIGKLAYSPKVFGRTFGLPEDKNHCTGYPKSIEISPKRRNVVFQHFKRHFLSCRVF